MNYLKLQTFIFLLTLPFLSFSQSGTSLPDIMEEKFPPNIAASSQYFYKFVETNGQRQLIEIGSDNNNSQWYCITDGTKTNSTFYGQVNKSYGYYADGDDFSFLRGNPDDSGILELLKYDQGQDTLLVANAFDFNLSPFEYVTIIKPDLFGIFEKTGAIDYSVRIATPSGNTFTTTPAIDVPRKKADYHPFISDNEYLYINNDSNGDLFLSMFDVSTAQATELIMIAEGVTTNNTAVISKQSNEDYEVVLLTVMGTLYPVVFNKQTMTAAVLDALPPYSSFNAPALAIYLEGEKLFVYHDDGQIEYYKLDNLIKTVIPYPSRGAIDYDGKPAEYLIKGDSIFLNKNAPSLGWYEYFYYDEANNQLEILVDDYYESNGFASRGGGMLLYDDKIMLGFKSGFDSCGVLFLEEDLNSHYLYTFHNDDFCVGDIWMNDDKIILRNFREVRVMEKDDDGDGFLLWDECNDFDSSINPDATEIAGNGIDENCDGVDLMTGINYLEKIQFTAFPNPTRDLVQLNLGASLQNISIEVFNTLGQRVWLNKYNNAHTLEIDLSSFSSGIYFVSLKSESGVGEVRVVKE